MSPCDFHAFDPLKTAERTALQLGRQTQGHCEGLSLDKATRISDTRNPFGLLINGIVVFNPMVYTLSKSSFIPTVVFLISSTHTLYLYSLCFNLHTKFHSIYFCNSIRHTQTKTTIRNLKDFYNIFNYRLTYPHSG
ncbi:hypothetical protein TNIN_157541 [Trichonephila inaurata madagascariensis]|uniref:Uncharacterized protein n=1 Tax=Trichonephila inaurata madagascariensis TaxID=2747483 RepID=A0A8X6Y7R5_9ARAC|nr:hypothetical protein TNIN_157541 [Trichonephila inaurata madagascariensis]